MSAASLWEKDRVKFKEMPTLQDALCVCDRDNLIRVLLDELTAYDSRQQDRTATKSARKRLASTLDVMQALPVDAKGNRDRVLFPSESFVLQGTSLRIVHRLGAVLLIKGDAPLVHNVRAHLEEGAGTDTNEGDPFSHEYALRPWEETLATKVWLAGPWCRRERYASLAAAFWEMTYFGFEYDRAHARMMHEKAARFVGGHRGSDAPARGGATISDVKKGLSLSMGLKEPDRFDLDYRDRLTQCVVRLNRKARIDLCDRVIDWERRVE